MNICVVRHGETDWNAEGRIQGREDIPLNGNGMAQARRCGEALRGGDWRAILTSPLKRARRTAEIIAEALGIPDVVDDPDLMERDYGNLSGLTATERATEFPEGTHAGVEAWEDLRDRIIRAVLRGAEKCAPGENIIVVSHGGAINALLAHLSGGEYGSGKTWLKNACVSLLEYQNGALRVIYYNRSAEEMEAFAEQGAIE